MDFKIRSENDGFIVETDATPPKVLATYSTEADAKAHVEKLNRIENGRTYYRYQRVKPDAFQDDNSFQIAISSEFPAEQRAEDEEAELGFARKGQKYLEVLSHDEKDVDLSRLNGNAAFLDEHVDSRHLGTIPVARLSADKVVRGVCKFDDASRLSKTRKKQMRLGSRSAVSVGYKHSAYLGPTMLPDGKVAHRFAWIGLEVSSVGVPADPGAGKGRSNPDEQFHCIRCGMMFGRNELDDQYMCGDCADAETPSDDDGEDMTDDGMPDGRSEAGLAILKRADDAKKPYGDVEYADNGMQEDGVKRYPLDTKAHVKAAWSYINMPKNASKYSASQLSTIKGKIKAAAKKLGIEIADERSEAELLKARGVDYLKSANADEVYENLSETEKKKLRTKFMTPEETAQAAETKVRAELEPKIRSAVAAEEKTKAEGIATKVKARNDQIHALATEFVKDYGERWGGEPGKVYRLGERFRSLEIELCAEPTDRTDAELRGDFKRKAQLLIETSREPKNQFDAAKLPDELAYRCSLRNIYNEAARTRAQTTCFIPTTGAEAEAHKEIHNRAKDFPGGEDSLGQGCILPINTPSGVIDRRHSGGRMKRDALAGDFPTAGALVAPQYIFPTIELLRNLPALGRAGMTIIGGVIGNLVLPRQEAPTTSQSLAEGAILAAYDQVFGQIKMNPHRVGSTQNYSRLAMLQVSPDFEAMIMNDHMAQNALRIDYLGINGQGANDEPIGILNQLGINSVVFAGSAANGFKNLVLMETLIRAANIYEEVSYITTSTARGTLRSTARLLVGATTVVAIPLWEDDEQVNGRPGVDSQQVPGNVIIALVGRHLVMAQWGGFAVVLDTLTRAAQDEYKLSVNTYIDFALRHPQAVTRSADSIAALA